METRNIDKNLEKSSLKRGGNYEKKKVRGAATGAVSQ